MIEVVLGISDNDITMVDINVIPIKRKQCPPTLTRHPFVEKRSGTTLNIKEELEEVREKIGIESIFFFFRNPF